MFRKTVQTKNKNKSAFFYFLQDQWKIRKNQPRIKNETNVEFTDRIGLLWQSLEPAAKERYRLLSEEGAPPDVKDVQETGRELNSSTSLMRSDLKNEITQLVNCHELEDFKFFVINMNAFCKVLPRNTSLPAEIGVVEVTLSDGIRRGFHKFFGLENIPLGYRREILVKSEEVHNIPPENFILAEKDHGVILDELLGFVNRNSSAAVGQVRLFCMDIEQTNEVLTTLVKTEGGKEYKNFHVLIQSLPELFFELANASCSKMKGPKNKNHRFGIPEECLALSILEKDEFKLTLADIGCQFHNRLDSAKFCALGKSVRQAYTVLSRCCPNLNLDMVPGKHYPGVSEHATGVSDWQLQMPNFSEPVVNRAMDQAIIPPSESLFGSSLPRNLRFKSGLTPLPSGVTTDPKKYFPPSTTCSVSTVCGSLSEINFEDSELDAEEYRGDTSFENSYKK